MHWTAIKQIDLDTDFTELCNCLMADMMRVAVSTLYSKLVMQNVQHHVCARSCSQVDAGGTEHYFTSVSFLDIE